MDNQRADTWLFEVEDVLKLSSLGLIVVGRLQPSGSVLCVGDLLTFLCPNGQKIVTHIESFPMISLRQSKELIAFELPKTEESKHIITGSQVFRHINSS